MSERERFESTAAPAEHMEANSVEAETESAESVREEVEASADIEESRYESESANVHTNFERTYGESISPEGQSSLENLNDEARSAREELNAELGDTNSEFSQEYTESTTKEGESQTEEEATNIETSTPERMEQTEETFMDSDPRYTAIADELSDREVKRAVASIKNKKLYVTDADAEYQLMQFGTGYSKDENGKLRYKASPVTLQNAFKERYPEEYQQYVDKEKARVYSDALTDPQYREFTEQLQGIQSKYKDVEEKNRWRSYMPRSSAHSAERLTAYKNFVAQFPEKAQAYRFFDKELDGAFKEPETPNKEGRGAEEAGKFNETRDESQRIEKVADGAQVETEIPKEEKPVIRRFRADVSKIEKSPAPPREGEKGYISPERLTNIQDPADRFYEMVDAQDVFTNFTEVDLDSTKDEDPRLNMRERYSRAAFDHYARVINKYGKQVETYHYREDNTGEEEKRFDREHTDLPMLLKLRELAWRLEEEERQRRTQKRAA